MEGNVKEFGLADVIQFIATSQKTGVLLLDHQNDTASIAFARGDITAAVYGRQGKQDQLQDYLFRSKKLDQATIEKITQIQKDTGLSVDEVMLKERIMTEDELFGIITFKIQEVIDDVFTWRDAHYKFDTQADLYSKSRTKVTIPAESLLMEAMRRKDEWPRIREAIPSEDIVISLKEGAAAPEDLPAEARLIFDCIDGVKNITGLIQASGLGRFRTFNALFILFELGLIERKFTEVPIAAKARPKESSPALKFIGPAMTAVATVGVCLILLTGGLFGGYKLYLMIGGGPNLTDQVLTKSGYHKYSRDLELYKMINGFYPQELSAVIKDPRFISRLAYQVSEDGQSYVMKLVEQE
jgi:hypothetical protein